MAEGVATPVFGDTGLLFGWLHPALNAIFREMMTANGSGTGVTRTMSGWKYILPAPFSLGIGIFAGEGIG